MKHDYISRYAKHETHFRNTDPWPLASFLELPDPNKADRIVAYVAVALAIIASVVVAL